MQTIIFGVLVTVVKVLPALPDRVATAAAVVAAARRAIALTSRWPALHHFASETEITTLQHCLALVMVRPAMRLVPIPVAARRQRQQERLVHLQK